MMYLFIYLLNHHGSLRSTYCQGCRAANDMNRHLTSLSIHFEGHAGRSTTVSKQSVLCTCPEDSGLQAFVSEVGMPRA